MIRCVVWPIAVLASIVVSAPAFAQREAGTGTLIKGRQITSAPVATWSGEPGPMSAQLSDAALSVARQMSACAIRINKRGVQRFLDGIDYAVAQANYARMENTISTCLTARVDVALQREMRFSVGTLHSLLAEAWILDSGLEGLDLAPVAVGEIKDELGHDGTADGILRALAWCLMRTRPTDAAALLRTRIGSDTERRAFASLGPLIPTCLDRDVTLKTSRPSLRLELASTAYTMQREALENASSSVRK